MFESLVTVVVLLAGFAFIAIYFKQQMKTMKDTFKALSFDTLKSSNESFLQLAKSSLEKYQGEAVTELENRQAAIDRLVKPLNESLAKVDQKIAELEKERLTAYASLTVQMKSVAKPRQNFNPKPPTWSQHYEVRRLGDVGEKFNLNGLWNSRAWCNSAISFSRKAPPPRTDIFVLT